MYVRQELLVPLRHFLGLPLSITLMGPEPPLHGLPVGPLMELRVELMQHPAPRNYPILVLPRDDADPSHGDSVELTNRAGFLFVPESSWLQPLLPLPGFPDPWVSLPWFLSLESSPHGWAWDLGPHPCLVHSAASDQLPDPNVGWSLLSRNQLAGRLLCTCFAIIRRPPRKQRPHSWELFGYFKLVVMSRNLSRGVFCFLACSSIWDLDMALRFLLSFTILISLFLSLPLVPHSHSFYFIWP